MTRDDYYDELYCWEDEMDRALEHWQQLRENGVVFDDDAADDTSDDNNACAHEDS